MFTEISSILKFTCEGFVHHCLWKKVNITKKNQNQKPQQETKLKKTKTEQKTPQKQTNKKNLGKYLYTENFICVHV